MKRQWEGERDQVRIQFRPERCVKAAGRVVTAQNESSWEMVWKIRKEDVVTENKVKEAKDAE